MPIAAVVPPSVHAHRLAAGPVTRVEHMMMENIVSNVHVRGKPNLNVVVLFMTCGCWVDKPCARAEEGGLRTA